MALRGSAQLGKTILFDLDNPLGTQCGGSTLVNLFLTRNPGPLYPCDSLRPGSDMDGIAGENLVNWSNPADRFRRLSDPIWNGAA